MTVGGSDGSSTAVIGSPERPKVSHIMINELPAYEIKHSKQLGRYLVAARDLDVQEVIFNEAPLTSGSTDEPGEIPMCLGCYSRMIGNPSARCPKCRHPVCDPECAKLKGHAENECQFFGGRVTYPPPNQWSVFNKCILILRCLLLKNYTSDYDPKMTKWDDLMTMESHTNLRKSQPNSITSDKKIMENFLKWQQQLNGPIFSQEEIVKVSGIIDVNAHVFPVKVNGDVCTSACHIYLKTSLMSHSCSPNAHWMPDSSNPEKTKYLITRTNRAVKKGEIISVSYNDGELMYGTLRRLLPMEISGLFICRCERCLDPTELGTHFSSLKCPRCREGYLVPEDPVDSFADWYCNNAECSHIASDEEVMEIIEEAEMSAGFPKKDLFLAPDDEDVNLLEEYISTFSERVLHPNHYILQEIHTRILASKSYRLKDMSDNELGKFLKRCEDVLAVAHNLVAGLFEYKAFVQYLYSKGLLILARRQREKNENESSMLPLYKKIQGLQNSAAPLMNGNYTVRKWRTAIKKDIQVVNEHLEKLQF